jgi:hypothetical protein
MAGHTYFPYGQAEDDLLTRDGTRFAYPTALTIGGVFALVLLSRRRRRAGLEALQARDRRTVLVAYLREHLSGSDAALRVVDRLGRQHAADPIGRLSVSLHEQFLEERSAVCALLRSLGASSVSVKRLAAKAAGGVLSLAPGGTAGRPVLYRTLEALAIGVQGKRLLWRTLGALPDLSPPARNFDGLETMAVRQWEAIERQRLQLAHDTFGT